MNKNITTTLWVVKFCLKVVYPKYNHYAFLVFLAIKFKLLWNKKRFSTSKIMDTFAVKIVPQHLVNFLIEDKIDNYFPIVVDKCIVISKEQYIQLCCENLFYKDNGILWITMKLSQEFKRSEKNTQNLSKNLNDTLRYNLSFMTSEIHKKLWNEGRTSSLDNVRIVPLIGSEKVNANMAFVTENEFYNISSSLNIQSQNIEVTFHTIPSFDHSPKLAVQAEVSLIVNSFDISNEYIKEVLNDYFELPRLLCENDVFSIDLGPQLTSKEHFKHLGMVLTAGKLYFKCKKLTSGTDATNNVKQGYNSNIIEALYVVKGMTQLTQGENIHMIKPTDNYFKSLDCRNRSIHSCPTGLKHMLKQMQEAVNPFINGDINGLSSSLSSPIIPMLLLTGALGSGRHVIVKTLAKCNGLSYVSIDCNDLQTTTSKQAESKIDVLMQKAKSSAPVIVVLDNFEVFAVDPENNEDYRLIEHFLSNITSLYQHYTKHPIIFVAITKNADLKPNILRLFLDKFHVPRLKSEERYQMLKWFAEVMELKIDRECINQTDIEDNDSCLSDSSMEILKKVAAKTETFVYGDLDTIVHFALRESYLKQYESANQTVDPDLKLVKEEDFNSALESIRKLQSQHLDAPKIPKVYWDDIGGLDRLKKELLKTIEFPIKYPHLFKNSSLKRSGIMMYGPPGCGKTLVAKAVSTELNVSFLSVKGPELLNMYIGQSEENVRKVFESARASAPCIVFLDELDALAPRRGAAGDSGGASDRVVSQLLAEIDGVADKDADTASLVFVMGATNRPDLIEQSLLRPGRLDKLIYVGPYCGLKEKTNVLTALCRNHNLRPEVDLESVAAALPESCTGADLLQVVTTARSTAVRTVINKLNAGLVKESELSPDSVVLNMSDLWQGVESFRPSVTEQELHYYESLKSNM